MVRWSGALVTLALATVASTGMAQARAGGGGASKAADDKVVALTEAKWARFMRASENLYKLENIDTSGVGDEDLSDADNAQTVAGIARAIDRIPPAKKAITAAGMTSTEYAEVQIAVLYAAFQMMADSIAKMYPGATKPAEVTDPVKKANVAFLQRHVADMQRLDALNKEQQAKAKAREEQSEEPAEPTEPDPARR